MRKLKPVLYITALLLPALLLNCGNVRTKDLPGIMPGRGAGPVEIGMKEETVLQEMGKPDETNEYDDGRTIYHIYYSKGMTLLVISGRLSTIFLYSGIKGGYEAGKHGAFAGKTPEGLGLDSNLFRVRSVYGEPESRTDLLYAPVPSQCLSYKKRGISFDFVAESGKLIFITIFKPEE